MKVSPAAIQPAATAALAVVAVVVAARRPRLRGMLLVAAAALLGRTVARRARGHWHARDTRTALGGARGSHVRSSVTIGRGRDEVHAFWSDLHRLSAALPRQVRVEPLGNGRSRWTLGDGRAVSAAWTAEVIAEEPGRRLAWRTVDDASVVSAGSVQFTDAPGGQGTEVHLHMQYSPPLGHLGSGLATVLGHGAERTVRESLHAIKRYLELGRHVALAAPPTH